MARKKLEFQVRQTNRSTDIPLKEQINSLRQLQGIDHEILLTQRDLSSQSDEDSNVNHKISKLRESRTKLAGKIEHSFLTQYEKLRSSITGSVFVLAEDGLCKGCHVKLPSNLYHQIQLGTALCMCPNCRRILFLTSKETEKT